MWAEPGSDRAATLLRIARVRSRRLARQGSGELRRGDNDRLLRDDGVEQHRMHLCIWVGAAITNDDQTIIQIAGVANGRQHDAAGMYTGDHERVDAVGAQQRLQVGTNERLRRCLTTIGSPSRGAAAGWIAAPSVPATAIPFAFTQLNRRLRGLTSG